MVRNEQAAAELRAIGAEAVIADLNDTSSLRAAVEGVSGVYHIAAAFRQARLSDKEYFQTNVDGTRNLFDAAIEAGVTRVVHCSTVGVLSHIEHPPADESCPYNPADVYQESKMQGELLALDYFKRGAIKGVVVRPAMIYGPGDTRTLKLFRMISKERFFYVGPGTSTVHFIDVRDLARAFEAAMSHTETNAEIYIIAGKHAVPLRAMAEMVARLLEVNPPWLCLPVKPIQLMGTLCELLCKPLGIEPPLYRRRVDFYTKDRHFSSAKAAAELGFFASHEMIEELEDIIESYRASGALSTIKTSAQMMRCVDGVISFWNRSAEDFYGFPKKDALGKTSHQLLRTDFPASLTEINQRLLDTGTWQGDLQHTKRDGSRVTVKSAWRLGERWGNAAIRRVYESNSSYCLATFASMM